MAHYIGKFQTPTEGFGLLLRDFALWELFVVHFQVYFCLQKYPGKILKKSLDQRRIYNKLVPKQICFFLQLCVFYIRSIYDLKMPQVKIMKIKIIRINTSNCINRFHNQGFYHSQLMWKQTEISDATITKNFQTEL